MCVPLTGACYAFLQWLLGRAMEIEAGESTFLLTAFAGVTASFAALGWALFVGFVWYLISDGEEDELPRLGNIDDGQQEFSISLQIQVDFERILEGADCVWDTFSTALVDEDTWISSLDSFIEVITTTQHVGVDRIESIRLSLPNSDRRYNVSLDNLSECMKSYDQMREKVNNLKKEPLNEKAISDLGGRAKLVALSLEGLRDKIMLDLSE